MKFSITLLTKKGHENNSPNPQFPEQLLQGLVLIGKAYTTPFYHGLEGPQRRQKSPWKTTV
jgi:hypothetical protein